MGAGKGIRRALTLIVAVGFVVMAKGQDEPAWSDSAAWDTVAKPAPVFYGGIDISHYEDLVEEAELESDSKLPKYEAYRRELEDVSDPRLEYYWYKLRH